MGFEEPQDLRSATLTISNEQVLIPSASPYQSRLHEVPSQTDGVKLRRITIEVFSGTGFDGLHSLGYYVGMVTRSVVVKIDTGGVVGTATFKWSDDGGSTWKGTLVPIPDTDPIDLELGIQIQFDEGTYVVDDQWTFTAEYWTEVSTVPIVTKTFQVNYANGLITFYSGDAGITIYASYEGRGSVVKAADVQQLISSLDQGENVMRNLNTSGLTVNKAVYIKSDATYGLASATEASKLAVGFVKVVDDDEGEIIINGRLGGFTGLTTGLVYYLDIDGNVSSTPSQTYRQVVGRALSASVLLVNIMLESILDEAQLIVLKGQNTSSLTLRQFVGLASIYGWAAANAHWSVKKPAVGCVKKLGTTDGEVLLKGLISGFSDLTRGSKYYLGETGGTFTTIPPTDSGDIQQYVGLGISSDTMLIDVEGDYYEVP